MVLVLSQFRGVARRRRPGMFGAGPKIGEGDLGHLRPKLQGHVRPEVRKQLHVEPGPSRRQCDKNRVTLYSQKVPGSILAGVGNADDVDGSLLS